MSSRHFTRAFIAETGTTPSKAVERLRIDVGAAARAILERSDRAGGGNDRLSRSGADAPCLHPRLRPAATIAAPCGEGGLISINRRFEPRTARFEAPASTLEFQFMLRAPTAS